MEPVKGGSLASMNNEIQGIMKAQNPDLSIPSWAVRFCAGLDNILTVLSGMSTKEQLDDNVSYMEHFEPLSDKEHEVLKTVVEKLNCHSHYSMHRLPVLRRRLSHADPHPGHFPRHKPPEAVRLRG